MKTQKLQVPKSRDELAGLLQDLSRQSAELGSKVREYELRKGIVDELINELMRELDPAAGRTSMTG